MAKQKFVSNISCGIVHEGAMYQPQEEFEAEPTDLVLLGNDPRTGPNYSVELAEAVAKGYVLPAAE